MVGWSHKVLDLIYRIEHFLCETGAVLTSCSRRLIFKSYQQVSAHHDAEIRFACSHGRAVCVTPTG